jgi:translation elongation factor EF-Tu-like GTPase
MLNLSALFWEPTAFGSCISEDGSETEDSKIDSMLFRLTPGRTYSVTQQSEGLNARIFVRNEDTLTQDSVFTNYQFNYTCPEDGSQRVMQLIREVDNENPIPFVSVY